MVEIALSEQVRYGTAGTAFGIIGSEVYRFNPCVNYGPRAHGTRFEGDVKVAVVKPPGV